MSIPTSTITIQFAKQYRAEQIRTAERSRIAAEFRKTRRFAPFRRIRRPDRGIPGTQARPAPEASPAI
jgi:hypothetical protein